jgi:hypothetical protein
MEHDTGDIQILCDGKPLPLGGFVATLYYDTLLAMVKNLKGAEDAETITLTLTRKPDKKGV